MFIYANQFVTILLKTKSANQIEDALVVKNSLLKVILSLSWDVAEAKRRKIISLE